MCEIMWNVFCLECGAFYIADIFEHVETCKRCGESNTEWSGFRV